MSKYPFLRGNSKTLLETTLRRQKAASEGEHCTHVKPRSKGITKPQTKIHTKPLKRGEP
jgi:hypothetical protein